MTFKISHLTISKTATHLLVAFSISILTALALCQCNTQKTSPSQLTKYSFSEPHLGTIAHIVIYSDQQQQATLLSQKCFSRIAELNNIFSDYQSNSELNLLCQKTINTPQQVSNHLFKVIAHAQKISAQTNGAFDITIGKQSQHWRNKTTPQTKDLSNYKDIQLDPKLQTITFLKPLQLDLGGIAKGYIADQLMSILKNADIIHCAVIIGGETILAAAPPGKKGWRIGIQNPQQEIIGTLTLSHTALSTSGDSYQFFEIDNNRLSHLIDPITKNNKSNRLNVTTIAPTAMQADTWATALRILPTQKSLPLANQQTQLQAIFIPHQQSHFTTNKFPTIATP